MRRTSAAVAVVATVGALTGFGAAPRHGPAPSPEKVVVLSDAAEDDAMRPDKTAGEWLTYADHVVVATAVRQDEHAWYDKRGRGISLRSVTMRVDEVVRSRPRPEKKAPKSFALGTRGYTFTRAHTDDRTRQAMEDRAWLEVGHRYIVALYWRPPTCAAGDPVNPGQWRLLGSDSILAYDGPIIGTGEMEGSYQTADARRAALVPNDPNVSLEDEMLGRRLPDLRTALDAATPVPAGHYDAVFPEPGRVHSECRNQVPS